MTSAARQGDPHDLSTSFSLLTPHHFSLYITSSLSQFRSYLLFISYSSFPRLDVMSDQPHGRGGRGRGPRGGVFGDRGGRGGRGRDRGDLQDHPFRPSNRGGRGDFRGGHGGGRGGGDYRGHGDFRGGGRAGGSQGPRIFKCVLLLSWPFSNDLSLHFTNSHSNLQIPAVRANLLLRPIPLSSRQKTPWLRRSLPAARKVQRTLHRHIPTGQGTVLSVGLLRYMLTICPLPPWASQSFAIMSPPPQGAAGSLLAEKHDTSCVFCWRSTRAQ